MCENKKFIYTRAKYINTYNSPIGYYIPCGKCPECVQQRANGYFVRAYYEYKNLPKGAYAYFDTLTYNDDNLPTICGLPSFSRKDVRNFFKRLRSNIVDFLYKQDVSRYSNIQEARKRLTTYISGRVRYIVVCEFGELNHRPHYHPLFYVNLPTLSLYDFKQLVDKSWKLGFTDHYLNCCGHVLNSSAAIRYLTNYLFKGCSYSEERVKILENIKEFLSEDEYKEVKRDFLPFIHCSVNFGMSMLDIISEEELNARGITIVDDLSSTVFHYQLPQYYKRKLYYNIVDDDGKPLWIYNELGYKRHVESIKNLVKTYEDKFEYLANYSSISSYNYFDGKIHELLDGRTFEDLAVYRLLYYNRMLPHGASIPPIGDVFEIIDADPYKDMFNPLSDRNITLEDKRRVIHEYRFNSISQDISYDFRSFDQLIKIFDEIELEFSKINCEKIRQRNLAREALRLIKKRIKK